MKSLFAAAVALAALAILAVGGDGAGPLSEPASWALMVVGFGGVGGLLRRRRRQDAEAA